MNQETVNNIKDYLIYLKEIGINELPIEIARGDTEGLKSGGQGYRLIETDDTVCAVHEPPILRTLEDVRNMIGDCKRCGLYKKRKNIVFGSGNEKAEIVFVGEAPGEDEDIKGNPLSARQASF